MERGMVHLSWGTGKGNTTAAMGLALRALGKGMGVTVVQFLKGGMSGELSPLERLGARIYSGAAGDRFFFQMSEAERKELAQAQTRLLHQALQVPCDLLILDEACAAWQLGAVDREMLRQAVLGRPEHCEVVLTGREPADWMKEAAHYSTEMVCHSHPFDRGTQARPGIEF